MRAMILAAGRGERMMDLSLHTPKPLIRVAGKYLIEHSLLNLKHAGIHEVVINVCYLKNQIQEALGDGSQYGIKIHYSEEVERLETGGGIFQALPLLGHQPFLVMSCDIITDYPLQKLNVNLDGLAHLIMVKNPLYHAQGDYGLIENKLTLHTEPKFTFANIGIYHPALFANCNPGHFRLTNVLNPAIKAHQVTGELYQGKWHNIGTPADITEIHSLEMIT